MDIWFFIALFAINLGNFLLGFWLGRDWQRAKYIKENETAKMGQDLGQVLKKAQDEIIKTEKTESKSAIWFAKGEKPDERIGTVEESFGNQNDV